MPESPILELRHVSVRVGGRIVLPKIDWLIRRAEQWAVLGPNGSGKSTLVRVAAGHLPSVGGQVFRGLAGDVGYVSFELQRRIVAQDAHLDHARFAAGRTTDLTRAEDLLRDPGLAPQQMERTVRLLEIGHLLKRPVRFLSTGEIRKVLIARALARCPEILILDEPFDGLDVSSRMRFCGILEGLIRSGAHLVLVTHRQEEVLPFITHVMCVRDGHVIRTGPRDEILTRGNLRELYGNDVLECPPEAPSTRSGENPGRAIAELKSLPIIELNNVSVRYGDVRVLTDLDWVMRGGEHWAIVGPNGSGKTTILHLITADNLQGYANDIRLFGRRRGSGESIWDIKQRMGVVTPHLQVSYLKSITALEVVLSGFFDSIGLYRMGTPDQRRAARTWMERLDLMALAERRFDRLSYGERRLVLIARALVKSPELLVLDEPCQGLDPHCRRRVLGLIDIAGDDAAVLFVTHHQDEMPLCISRVLELIPSPEGSRARVS